MNKRPTDVLDNIGDGFITLDNELLVTCFNGAAERLLGRKAEEVLGKKLFESFPEARGSISEEKYTAALKNGEAVTFEACFDSQPYKNWYEVRVYSYKDGIAVYFTLIAEREERFRQNNEDLNLLNNLNNAANRGESLQDVIRLCSREMLRIFSAFGAAVYL